MDDYNAIDTTEDGQRKLVHSGNEIRSLPSWRPRNTQGKVAQGTCLGESLENRKGEKCYEAQKAKRSKKNKHSKNKRRYRSTSSSSSIEKSSPPKRHKSRRKKRKHRKHSYFLSCSSSLSSSLESSETRSRDGLLGSRFQVIYEEDKFRCNLPTDIAEYANTHFQTYSETANINGKSGAG